jgi:hypothetical protein
MWFFPILTYLSVSLSACISSHLSSRHSYHFSTHPCTLSTDPSPRLLTYLSTRRFSSLFSPILLVNAHLSSSSYPSFHFCLLFLTPIIPSISPLIFSFISLLIFLTLPTYLLSYHFTHLHSENTHLTNAYLVTLI